MLWKKVLVGVLLLGICRCYGGISIEGDGRVSFGGGVTATPMLFGENYSYPAEYRGALRAAPAPGARSGVISGEWKLHTGKCGLVTLLWHDAGNGAKDLEYRVNFSEPIPIAELALSFTLPLEFGGREVRFDSEKLVLPLTSPKEPTLAVINNSRTLTLALDDGILNVESKQPFSACVMDNRNFQQYNYSIRLRFPGVESPLRSASMKVRVRFQPYTVTALDLSTAANRGFADAKADDGEGGWNDQGPETDLSQLPAGKLNVGPFSMTILDEARRPGKSCVVSGDAPNREWQPEAIPLPKAAAGKILYLLHAVAWAPAAGSEAGRIELLHPDGTETAIPLICGKDVGDWWLAGNLENGMVAWSGTTRSGTPVGLYLSAFELPDEPLAALRFRARNGAVWMVAAAALGEERIPFRRESVQTLRRNEEWRPFRYERSVEPGSAMDFSFLNDAPAGKHGFVTVKGERFVFEESGDEIRFHGGNLTFESCYPTHEEADVLAERLSRIGYNAVRLHHFDLHLPESKEVPDALDRLEYLVAACKKNGIYISLDLYTLRTGWNNLGGIDYKLAVILIPEARAEFKEFIRRWLTHVNKYTNLRWCDDPVFNSISIVNENPLFYILNLSSCSEMAERYRTAFAQWTEKKGVDVSSGDAQGGEFRRFLDELYREYYADMKHFLRELGVKAPLTEQNCIPAPNLAAQRALYDYVDNHLYWDHPSNYALPFNIRNTSVLSERMRNPREIAPSRIFGLPFTVTEYNYCFPNAFRAECGPIFGTMAAFQSWDGLYRFTYGTAARNVWGEPSGIEIFEGANDPIQTLGERIIAALFLRGDAAAAQEAYPVAVPEEQLPEFRENFPEACQELMFSGRVGTVLTRRGEVVTALPAGTRQLQTLDDPASTKKTTRYSAPEWAVDFAERTFKVATPRSEALVLPAEHALTGKLLTVKNGDTFGVVAAISVDGRPLSESSRMLLLHLTDVQLEESRYLENANGNRLYSAIPSTGTLLARRGRAQLRLELPEERAEHFRLYALSPDGKRLYEQPFRKEGGIIQFDADTFGRDGAVVFGYELIKEE